MEDFLGTYDYNLDEKGRLSIPAKYRKVMARLKQDTFIISTLEDSCLTLYPYTTFRERIAKKIEEMPQIDEDANEIRRKLGLSTTDASLDNQGRIMIPASFSEHGNIDKAVKIIGCTNKIELWNPKTYRDFAEKPDAKSIKDELKKFKI